MSTDDATISRTRTAEREIVRTAAGQRSPSLAEDLTGSSSDQANWDKVIDQKLIEWGLRGPEIFEGDLIPPSMDALAAAVKLVGLMKRLKQQPPARVVPDADGGVVFEWHHGSGSSYLEVARDGSIELLIFHDCDLRARLPVQLP